MVEPTKGLTTVFRLEEGEREVAEDRCSFHGKHDFTKPLPNGELTICIQAARDLIDACQNAIKTFEEREKE